MKMRITILVAMLCIAVLGYVVGSIHAAESANKYQVTGPVLAVTDTMIAVQKGKDRWELARDASTKVNGDLKVGSSVTAYYRMIAVQVDVKPAKATTAKPAKP